MVENQAINFAKFSEIILKIESALELQSWSCFSVVCRVKQNNAANLQLVLSNTKKIFKHIFSRTAAGDILLGTKEEHKNVR